MRTVGRWLWGAFFVLAAVLVVASQVTGFSVVGFWSILATVLLVAILIKSLTRLNFFGVLLPAALLYIIYQTPLSLYYIQPWLLILAAALGGIGLSLIIRRRPGSNPHAQYNRGKYGQTEDMQSALQVTEDGSDDNHPTGSVRFGAASRYIHATALESGNFSARAGALEVYFDEAQLSPNGAEIYVNCSMASITLYIPKSWHVEEKVYVFIGAVENDTRAARYSSDAPTVTLVGNIHLGSVEIKYV